LTVNNYLPPAVYLFLLRYCQEHSLSLKEVELVFLRRAIKELGFKCTHQDVRLAKSNGSPYCPACYTRMKMVEPPHYRGKIMIKAGKYEELPTFIEEEEKLR
jgi:hypothetical protein